MSQMLRGPKRRRAAARPLSLATPFKVYRIDRLVEHGWKGVLRSWPIASASYDWDLLEAEHQVVVNANTSTISRVHLLVFNVRKSRTDDTVMASFTIGNSKRWIM